MLHRSSQENIMQEMTMEEVEAVGGGLEEITIATLEAGMTAAAGLCGAFVAGVPVAVGVTAVAGAYVAGTLIGHGIRALMGA